MAGIDTAEPAGSTALLGVDFGNWKTDPSLAWLIAGFSSLQARSGGLGARLQPQQKRLAPGAALSN